MLAALGLKASERAPHSSSMRTARTAQYNHDMTLTYTTEQAAALAQIFLVMLIATGLSLRFEGIAKTSKDLRTFGVAYGSIIGAILTNVLVLIFDQDLKLGFPWSPAIIIMGMLNILALTFGLAALAGQTYAIVKGVRKHDGDPGIDAIGPTTGKNAGGSNKNATREFSITFQYGSGKRRGSKSQIQRSIQNNEGSDGNL